MTQILESLRQPSAWRGLIWILTAIGINLSPDEAANVMALGAAAAGTAGALIKD
jgi:hypothetical protein